jgi:hypothetical protein
MHFVIIADNKNIRYIDNLYYHDYQYQNHQHRHHRQCIPTIGMMDASRKRILFKVLERS